MIFQESSCKNRSIRLPKGQNLLSYNVLIYSESKHNILALVGEAKKRTQAQFDDYTCFL